MGPDDAGIPTLRGWGLYMLGLLRRRFGAYSICALAAALGALTGAAPAWAASSSPDWNITKTADRAYYTAIGQTINYTYVITNTSADDFFGVTVTDQVQGTGATITVNCPSSNIASGGTLTCTASYVTTADDLAADGVTNVATADGNHSNESSLPTLTVSATVANRSQPFWTLTKTPSPTTYTAAGQTIAYNYVLTNTGGVDISSIQLTDDKVSGITCPATTLAPTASMTCTGNYVTTDADVLARSVTNTATAKGTPASGTLADATAQATVNLVAQPSWTLTKTPTPTTYAGAGQTISYSYVLTNTGNVGVSAISVSDDKISSVSCPTNTLNAGESMTCSGSYQTTSADVTAGSVTNHATAHGTPGAGTLADATAQATVTHRALNGSITIVKTAIGGNGTFSFSSTVAGAASFTLTTAGGTATRSFANLAAGTYTFTETSLPFQWNLTALTCSGDNGGTPTTVDLAARKVSIGLDGGEAIICVFTNTFDVTKHVTDTQQVIRRFLSHRMSLLESEGPDRARFIRRVPGSLWGDDNSSGAMASNDRPFSFSGSTAGANTRMVFSTSLSQMMRAGEKADEQKEAASGVGAMAYAGMPRKAPPLNPQRSAFDLWLEAHYLTFGSNLGNVDNDGNFGVVYVGADYLLTPSVLVGGLVQFDWMNEKSQALNSEVAGRGTMAGPYLSVRLTPNMFLDARAAWGLSDNDVNPFGLYTDNFTTDRWLAHAKLTGNWHWDAFRLTPSVALDYIQEHQRDYTDTLGVPIPGQTVSLGRVSFGPEIARRYFGADGTAYEPLLALTGEWDFDRPDVASINGLPVSAQALHARLQGGMLVRAPTGLTLRVVGTYEGIGDPSLNAYGGQIWVNVPLD